MRSEDFFTTWPNLSLNTFATVGEFYFCKVFSLNTFRNANANAKFVFEYFCDSRRILLLQSFFAKHFSQCHANE